MTTVAAFLVALLATLLLMRQTSAVDRYVSAIGAFGADEVWTRNEVIVLRHCFDKHNAQHLAPLGDRMVPVFFDDNYEDIATAIRATITALNIAGDPQKRTADAIIGTVFSSSTTFVWQIAAAYGVPCVSYQATSDRLTNVPLAARIVPPDGQQGVALVNILRHFGIHRIAILATDEDYGRGMSAAIATECKRRGDIRIVASQAVDPAIPVDGLVAALDLLQQADARIIVLLANFDPARRMLEGARDAGMTDSGYLWVMTDASGPVTQFPIGAIGTNLYTNYSTVLFKALYDEMLALPGTHWDDSYAPQGLEASECDSVETWARTFAFTARIRHVCCNATIVGPSRTQAGFCTIYEDLCGGGPLGRNDSDACWQLSAACHWGSDWTDLCAAANDTGAAHRLLSADIVRHIHFDGVSGPIAIGANGDNVGMYAVVNQVQSPPGENQNATSFATIGVVMPDLSVQLQQTPLWPGRLSEPPLDHRGARKGQTVPAEINVSWFAVGITLAPVGAWVGMIIIEQARAEGRDKNRLSIIAAWGTLGSVVLGLSMWAAMTMILASQTFPSLPAANHSVTMYKEGVIAIGICMPFLFSILSHWLTVSIETAQGFARARRRAATGNSQDSVQALSAEEGSGGGDDGSLAGSLYLLPPSDNGGDNKSRQQQHTTVITSGAFVSGASGTTTSPKAAFRTATSRAVRDNKDRPRCGYSKRWQSRVMGITLLEWFNVAIASASLGVFAGCIAWIMTIDILVLPCDVSVSLGGRVVMGLLPAVGMPLAIVMYFYVLHTHWRLLAPVVMAMAWIGPVLVGVFSSTYTYKGDGVLSSTDDAAEIGTLVIAAVVVAVAMIVLGIVINSTNLGASREMHMLYSKKKQAELHREQRRHADTRTNLHLRQLLRSLTDEVTPALPGFQSKSSLLALIWTECKPDREVGATAVVAGTPATTATPGRPPAFNPDAGMSGIRVESKKDEGPLSPKGGKGGTKHRKTRYVTNKTIELEDVLGSSIGRQILKDTAAANKSPENVAFVWEVRKFRKIKTDAGRLTRARYLRSTFFPTEAEIVKNNDGKKEGFGLFDDFEPGAEPRAEGQVEVKIKVAKPYMVRLNINPEVISAQIAAVFKLKKDGAVPTTLFDDSYKMVMDKCIGENDWTMLRKGELNELCVLAVNVERFLLSGPHNVAAARAVVDKAMGAGDAVVTAAAE